MPGNDQTVDDLLDYYAAKVLEARWAVIHQAGLEHRKPGQELVGSARSSTAPKRLAWVYRTEAGWTVLVADQHGRVLQEQQLDPAHDPRDWFLMVGWYYRDYRKD